MMSPVETILKRYPLLLKGEIVMEVGDWFNAVGLDEFEKARKSGLIQKSKKYPEQWELVNKKKASVAAQEVEESKPVRTDNGTWITVKGTHIFIENGKTKEEAIKDFFEKTDVDGPTPFDKKESKVNEKSNYKDDDEPSVEISEHPEEMKQIIKELGIEQKWIDGTAEWYLKQDSGLAESVYKDAQGDIAFMGSVIEHTDELVIRSMKKAGTFDQFTEAVDDGDYITSDKIFIDSIKDHPEYENFKEREEDLQGYNKALHELARTTMEYHRFTDEKELDSYLEDDPRFGVSTYATGEGTDYKCLTVEAQSPFFEETKKVRVTYPSYEIIGDEINTARYTQLPRSEWSGTNRSNKNSKNAKFAGETEVRIDSSTKVPVGKLEIKFSEYMSNKEKLRLEKRYGSLGTLEFPWADPDEEYEHSTSGDSKKASTVVALTSSQQTTDEDGKWITSNGQHIFIPNGQDQGEVLKEHFDNLEKKDDTKTKLDNIMNEHKDKMKNKEKEKNKLQKEINKPGNPMNFPEKKLSEFSKDNKVSDEWNKELDDAFGKFGDQLDYNAKGINAEKLQRQIHANWKIVKDSAPKLYNGNREEGLKELEKQVPELMPDIRKQLAHEDKVNEKMQKVFDKAKYVYRGVGDAELKSIEDSGKIKLVEDSNWDFVYSSLSTKTAEQFGEKDDKGDPSGNIIRMDKEKLGDNVNVVKYASFYFFVDIDNNPENYQDHGFESSRAIKTVSIKNGTSADAIDEIYISNQTLKARALLVDQTNISKASTVVALTSSQQTMEEDGSWITVKGTHIFIPNGSDQSEVIKEHFRKFTVPGESTPSDFTPDKKPEIYSGHKSEIQSIDKELGITKNTIDKLTEIYSKPDISLHTVGNSFGYPEIGLYDVELNVKARKFDRDGEFDKAMRTGNFESSDKIFAEGIKSHSNFIDFKKREASIHAFNIALKNKASKAKEFHRFLLRKELDSYLEDSPEFGASTRAIGENSDYKCLTVEPFSKYFGEGTNILVSYPADEIRDGSETVQYTQFPRVTDDEVQANINSTKNSTYASETEVRVKDTTKVPVGKLKIKFNEYMSFKTRDKYIEKYGSLGTLEFPRVDEEFEDHDD